MRLPLYARSMLAAAPLCLFTPGCSVYDAPDRLSSAHPAVVTGWASSGQSAAPDAGEREPSMAPAPAGTLAPPPSEPPPLTAADDAGVPDPTDLCPKDPRKTRPGACGCGLPDEDNALVAGCRGLRAHLLHRYAFERGALARDSVGSADATLQGDPQPVEGGLRLLGKGATEQWVELPAGMLSRLTSATIEAWLRWDGSAAGERVFDFGSSQLAVSVGLDQSLPIEPLFEGRSYLYLTARDGTRNGTPRAVFRLPFEDEVIAEGAAPLPRARMTHVAVVVDGAQRRLLLYVDGQDAGHANLDASLSGLEDSSSWLGRSQFSRDPFFTGDLYELRIYDDALSAAQLATSWQAGPDPAFLRSPDTPLQ